MEAPPPRAPDAVRCCVVTLTFQCRFPRPIRRPVPISEMPGMASVPSAWRPGVWAACAGLQAPARPFGVGTLLGAEGPPLCCGASLPRRKGGSRGEERPPAGARRGPHPASGHPCLSLVYVYSWARAGWGAACVPVPPPPAGVADGDTRALGSYRRPPPGATCPARPPASARTKTLAASTVPRKATSTRSLT